MRSFLFFTFNFSRQNLSVIEPQSDLPLEIFYDDGLLMRTSILFFMDQKHVDYKIDPDNQMYFLDITGIRVSFKTIDGIKWNEVEKWQYI